MIRPTIDDFLSEPERYELAEVSGGIEWDRREFFKITGAGIIVALLAGDDVLAQPRGPGGGGPQDVGAWIHIG